jgi:hypothetical protein
MLPDSLCAIDYSQGQQPPVRAQRHSIDRAGVPVYRQERRAARDAPQRHLSLRGAGNGCCIGNEGRTATGAGVLVGGDALAGGPAAAAGRTAALSATGVLSCSAAPPAAKPPTTSAVHATDKRHFTPGRCGRIGVVRPVVDAALPLCRPRSGWTCRSSRHAPQPCRARPTDPSLCPRTGR